ncbi:hypothetical protein Vadar_034477 [Vaccinium darrowii]|uniref:Uncharacterized protein n=1 Tax=Vaccinium darrowii TaxID=229202 RepID=A0ACB7YI29_9ERIC|nr:hypothetical protein Vadar_034477 [Vaccinium darrowii]
MPELRELRSVFADRNGNSIEANINKEALPPTKELKLQLIQDIALESDLQWDSKALEQKLYNPPNSVLENSPYEVDKAKEDLKPPHSHSRADITDNPTKSKTKDDLPVRGRNTDDLPVRAASLQPEPMSPVEKSKGRIRASSYEPDTRHGARLAAVRGK